MRKKAKLFKAKLLSIIREVAATPWLFVKNPGKDFSRKRKLTFEKMLLFLLGMGGGPLQSESLEFSDFSPDTATVSAFVQQRDKILTFALEFLLHSLVMKTTLPSLYKGYRLLAGDGTDLHTPTNPLEPENFFQTQTDAKGYNLLHLNALYDLSNRCYVGAFLQHRREANEHKALIARIQRSRITGKVILLADRGYESYNNFAHMERKGWCYLFRVQAIRGRGILSGLDLPKKPEFDVTVSRMLTRRQTEVKQKPTLYRFLPTGTTFDFLSQREDKPFPMTFRGVRFPLSNGDFETVITNLPRDAFHAGELKTLYNLRWGIGTTGLASGFR